MIHKLTRHSKFKQTGKGLFDKSMNKLGKTSGSKWLRAPFSRILKRSGEDYTKFKRHGNKLRIAIKGTDGKKILHKLKLSSEDMQKYKELRKLAKTRGATDQAKHNYKNFLSGITSQVEKKQFTNPGTKLRSTTQFDRKNFLTLAPWKKNRKTLQKVEYTAGTNGKALEHIVTEKTPDGLKSVSRMHYDIAKNGTTKLGKIEKTVSDGNKNWLAKKVGWGDRKIVSKFNDQGRIRKITRNRGLLHGRERTKFSYGTNDPDEITGITVKTRKILGTDKNEIRKEFSDKYKQDFAKRHGLNKNHIFDKDKQYKIATNKVTKKYSRNNKQRNASKLFEKNSAVVKRSRNNTIRNSIKNKKAELSRPELNGEERKKIQNDLTKLSEKQAATNIIENRIVSSPYSLQKAPIQMTNTSTKSLYPVQQYTPSPQQSLYSSYAGGGRKSN